LDGRHIFFTQQDVDGFRSDYKEALDDFVMMKDISPALNIYSVYKQRVKERVGYVKSLLAKGGNFEFKSERSIAIKRDKLPWPKNQAESDQLWRDIIENEMLEERFAEIAKQEKEAEKKSKAAEKQSVSKEASKKSNEPKLTPQQEIIKSYERLAKDVEETDTEDQVNYFLSSLATAYDPHTDYMSTRESEAFDQHMTNRLFGIGAVLQIEDDLPSIQGLVVGGPADKQGDLQPDDQILGVAQGNENFVETKFMKLAKIVEMIRGDAGTTVRLKVRPASDPTLITEISIVRAEVALKDNLAKAELLITPADLGPPMKVGWIDLPSFYADMKEGTVSTTKDVESLLRRLLKEGIDGLVLDLRGNGGGSLEEAIKLTGLFIPSGPVVQIKDWKGEISFRDSPNKNALYTGPMIVLTDKTSASASEILAGALQDYRRAIIVGDKSSFGKGTVQTIQAVDRFMPFFADKSRAGNIKVTIQKFYRISGGSTQLKGVVPDLHLPSVRDYMDFGESSYDNPMPYDQIPALNYDFTRSKPLPVAELRSRLQTRIKSNPDFTYVEDEARRYKERIDKNTISLNLEEREKERKANDTRRDLYEESREKRAQELLAKQKNGIERFHLTLDNPQMITQADFTKETSSGIKQAKKDDEDDKLDDPKKLPYGIDAYRLETLHILRDMVDFEKDMPATAANAETKSVAPQQ
jgi:carboxyl-terminal processing protease